MANRTTVTTGIATTSATLYSVTPIRSRIWCCQYCPRAKETTRSRPPPTAKPRQGEGSAVRASLSANARQTHATRTPSPYPIAALTPHTSP